MKRLVMFAIVAALAACGKNHQNNMVDANGTTDGLSDNGPCAPEALRCNGNEVEQCNATGTNWVPQQMCQFGCLDGQCALNGLDVASDQQLDGLVVVKGLAHIHNGATLSSPSGNLTIIADEIDVDMGGTISVAPTGTTALGVGLDGQGFGGEEDGTGGSYGTSGIGWTSSSSWGSIDDSDVQAGSPGGKPFNAPVTFTAAGGGGVLKLLAPKIVIAGQLTASGANGTMNTTNNCGGGGGSGGGVLVAGDDVTVSGSISAAGGAGLVKCDTGKNDGGLGRVKILFGSAHAITGSILGTQTVGLAPPYPINSATHSDPNQIYNDDFASLDTAWQKPFASVQGYYVKVDQTATTIPTAANGTFVATPGTSLMPTAVRQGTNYIHVVSIDAMSNIGTIETNFQVQINTSPPAVTSSSHPNPTQFSTNVNPFFSWSFPQGDASVIDSYYVFDNYGVTVPKTTDTKLPATQKNLLQSNVANGVWVLHVVSADSAGRLTKAAGHYRVSIGPDPGSGNVSGHVVNGAAPVSGATVTVNRGLYTTTTDVNGNYTMSNVTSGMWEVSVTSGTLHAAKTATIAPSTTTTVDLTF
jgi:hypothetical protein